MCTTSAMTPAPFRLPLNDAQFRRALQAGHGRALMHVVRHGVGQSLEAVVDACIHNRAYDAQCEGDRARWMLEIIDAGHVEQEVVPSILASLEEPATEAGFWDHLQRCRLAAALVGRGYTEAREALYHAFGRHDNSGDLIGGEEIIQLDGTDGLLHVAETMGSWLQADSEMLLDDAPLEWYDQIHGEDSARRVLETAARQNASVERYLEYLDRRMDRDRQTIRLDQVKLDPQRSERRRWQTKALSAQDMVDFIEGRWPKDRDTPLFQTWARHASDDELQVIAEHLFCEPDVGRKRQYLRLFRRRPLPAYDQRLVALTEHEDERVRSLAMVVLAQHEEPEVRELALARVKAGRVDDGELQLFARHYRPGDHKLMERVLDANQDADTIHGWMMDLRTVFEHNPLPELHPMMLFAYEHSPCGICRAAVVEALIKAGTLPQWVREECRFDADDGIREQTDASGDPAMPEAP